jgi:hypothetical protein
MHLDEKKEHRRKHEAKCLEVEEDISNSCVGRRVENMFTDNLADGCQSKHKCT